MINTGRVGHPRAAEVTARASAEFLGRSGSLLVMGSIEVRGLRKTYGATVAVDMMDLDVSDGEILGVLGPNGSGKTTTVECSAGLRSRIRGRYESLVSIPLPIVVR